MDFLAPLDASLLGNPARDWLTALGIALSLNILVGAIKWLSRTRLAAVAARTATPLDDSLVAAVKRTQQWLVLLVTLFVGAHYLELPERLWELLRALAVIAAFLQIGLWASALIEFWIGRSKQQRLATDPATATTLGAVKFMLRVVLWALLLLLMLDNLGVNVTALVAGLGVGGIAVALAVQNILGDLFASLSIVIDKPFVLGDFLIIDDYMGTVEHIGLKTTRIRSLGGEQLVFANSDLLKARLRNYQRMQERRILFRFGVLYSTGAEQLEAIPEMLRRIIEAQPEARFDRAHLNSFADSALEYEVVYWMLTPDYTRYMDAQQAINLAMIRAFRDAGIDFAFPTRTVHVASMPSAPAAVAEPASGSG
jgi:small-conductance mechanosensitive channel